MVKMLDKKNPRAWYSALMDYGADLKKSGVQINNRSKHYSKQSKFEGSTRQLRGEILKAALTTGKVDVKKIAREAKRTSEEIRMTAESLFREGLLGTQPYR